jgi:hypothetical protein
MAKINIKTPTYQIVDNYKRCSIYRIDVNGKIHYIVKSTFTDKYRNIKFSDIESAKCFISLLFSVLY